MTTSVVITDTSVLINFLVLDQLHALSQLTEFDFSVTEHVRAEITEHFPEQLQRLNSPEFFGCGANRVGKVDGLLIDNQLPERKTHAVSLGVLSRRRQAARTAKRVESRK